MNNTFNVQPQPQTQTQTHSENQFQPKSRQNKKPFSRQFASSFRIESKDMPFIALGVAGAAYLGFTDPILLATILFSFIVAGSLYFISACLPLVSKKLNFRVTIWHVLTIAFGLTLALNSWEPSHALFLSGLETAIVDILPDDASVEDAQIETLFTFIRIALILVGLGGGFAAWQQQQQGQSMTPIIMFVGGLFGVVLALDIMTAVVIA